jgi:hypothetical protein
MNIEQFLENFKMHSLYCISIIIPSTYGRIGSFPIQNASSVSRNVWDVVIGITSDLKSITIHLHVVDRLPL